MVTDPAVLWLRPGIVLVRVRRWRRYSPKYRFGTDFD